MIHRILIILLIGHVLAGCTWWGGRASDGSQLTVEHRCDVVLQQNAKASGADDADVIETVTVNPDCTTNINFRQTVGKNVSEIEQGVVAEPPND